MTMTRKSYCGCLYYAANALARKLTRIAEEEFAPTGLAPSAGFIVMTVVGRPGIAAGEIAEVMQLQPSTVTRLLDKLEKEGYVARRTAGKFALVYATRRAGRLNPRLKAAWRNLYARYAAVLGEEESRNLTAMIGAAGDRLD